MLAPDGRARIQVFPKQDLADSANLEEFIDGVTRGRAEMRPARRSAWSSGAA